MRFLAILASLIFLAGPAFAGTFPVVKSVEDGVDVYSLRVTPEWQANDFSVGIPSCNTMVVTAEDLDSTAQFTLYPADNDDDTVAEVEANTAIEVVTSADSSGVTVSSSKRFVRFVVDTAATREGDITVTCEDWESPAAQKQIIYSWKIEGAAATQAGYANTACWPLLESLESDSYLACSNDNTKMAWSEDVVITDMKFIHTSDGLSTGGCGFALSVDEGTSQATGADLQAPSANGAYSAGLIDQTNNIGLSVAAGTSVNIQGRDGDFCVNGAACTCEVGRVNGQLEIWGYFN